LPHVLVRLPHAAAAPGGELAPGALSLDALAGRRVLDGHLVPVALELLGDELSEAGDRALAHLGAHGADDGAVVRADRDPDGDLGRAVRGAHDFGSERGQAQSEREPAADRGAGDEELATADLEFGP